MLKIYIRTLSGSAIRAKGQGPKPAFRSRYEKEGPVSLAKSLSARKDDQKPWEEVGLTKDEYFKQKYGNISNERREALQRKVERQRRARNMRKEHTKHLREDFKVQRNPRKDTYSEPETTEGWGRGLGNPLSEYLYGTHAVFAALSARRRELFSKLLVQSLREIPGEVAKAAKELGLKVEQRLSKGELNRLTNNGVHNGVVLETKPLVLPLLGALGDCDGSNATYEVSTVNELYGTTAPVQRAVARAAAAPTEPAFPLGIYVDSITDPQNIGAIARSAFYLGADFLIVPSHNTAKIGPVAAKAAAGALDLLDLYQVDDPLHFIDASSRHGWSVVSSDALPHVHPNRKIASTLATKAIEVAELPSILRLSPVLLVMGSEGDGIRANIKLKSDYIVSLHQQRAAHNHIVDSLNVSVASALLLSKCLS